MARFDTVELECKLKRYSIDDNDLNAIEKDEHLKMLELIYLIRNFEQTLLKLKDSQLVNGPVHTSIGQEAVAAGCGIALKRDDLIGSTHRAHHHFLGKAIPCYYPDNYNPSDDDFSTDMQMCVEKTLFEIMGLKYGWCGGRGGSMHLRNQDAGIIGTNAIVGGGIALTTGAGWAQKLRGTSHVVVVFIGDGAVNQGILLESANMAKLLNMPVTYFIENNLYAVGTSTKQSSSTKNLAQRALAFGMDGIIVDGMDPAAVYLLMREIRENQETGDGPIFVEAKTYRFFHHAGKLKGSAFKYRGREEEEQWLKRDPFVRYSERLKKYSILSNEEDRFLMEKVKKVIQQAVSKVTSEKDGKLYIPDEHWPDRSSINRGVPGSQDEFRGIKFSEREDFSRFNKYTFVNIMSQVAARNMEKDQSVIILGEEVANLGGGAYNATKFPLQKFPERVINTPISEAGFTGIAFGASLCGVKPIVEIMFPDFTLVAADQLFNQIAKLKYLYGGDVEIPLVVRTRIASGLGYGAQHSSDLCGLYAMFRGWRIIAPSNPFDYIGLFNTAVLCKDPVLVLEHHSLYRVRGEIPKDNMDYFIEFGKASVFREGRDITIVTYLRGISIIENIADELESKGISVEGVDLRCLDYHSIDYDTIGKSIGKTGRLIVLEESPKSFGVGARIADEVQMRFFDLLKKPVFHINSIDVPLPVSKKLEEEILINEATVKSQIINHLHFHPL